MTAPTDETPPTVADEPPTRPTWATKPPGVPWCPVEWSTHLSAFDRRDALEAVEVATRHVAHGDWQIVAASRRGRLHAHRGEHREDAVAVRATVDGWCGAVADGAGSAPYSRIGALIATQAFCDTFAAATGPLEARATASASACYLALRNFAVATGLAPRDLRTTLLAVAVSSQHVVSLHVGDGGLVLRHADGTVLLPHEGDAGEFSGEVMHFLPDDGSEQRLLASVTVRPIAGLQAVLLATDGIEDPWYPLARNAPRLFGSLHSLGTTDAEQIREAIGVQWTWNGSVLGSAAAGTAMGEWLTFEKRGENDDRTLLVAYLDGVH